jgi:hypothetical protein
MTAGKQGKVRSRQKWQSRGGQRVSLEMLPGFRMTLLLLNRGNAGAAALKEAGPADSVARSGQKHSRSHGRPSFPVTTSQARMSLPFGVLESSPRFSLRPAIHRERNWMLKNHLSIPDPGHTWRGFQDLGRW